jgi:hypothetical protein
VPVPVPVLTVEHPLSPQRDSIFTNHITATSLKDLMNRQNMVYLTNEHKNNKYHEKLIMVGK